MDSVEVDCVIAGGGPAGMVLGYVLARAGLRVTVLEKHADFLRDFRGDTIHPSTITLLGELGLRERFLELPLTRITTMDIVIDGRRITPVDFGTLPAPDDFLVLAPQWEFLTFLATEGRRFPGFDLRMETAAVALIEDDGIVRGVHASGPDGEVELRATLTVAADGRSSALRDAAGLVPVELGVPIDVLWFSLPRPDDPPPTTLGYLSPHGMVLTIDRGDHYQAGMVIRKGGLDVLRRSGLAAFRARIEAAAPVLAPVVAALAGWDQVKLLSVQLNRLRRWHRPGFVAIGDAAHAMSPMFGVGVNYAIQDAVALANAVHPHLPGARVPEDALASFQSRRQQPVARMQRAQRFGHSRIARQAEGGRIAPRWAIRMLALVAPVIRAPAARFIGVGFRPEHVDRRGVPD